MMILSKIASFSIPAATRLSSVLQSPQTRRSTFAALGAFKGQSQCTPRSAPFSSIAASELARTTGFLSKLRGGGANSGALRMSTSVAQPEIQVAKPVEKFRKDYAPPPHVIKAVELDFQLHTGGERTVVSSKMSVTHAGGKGSGKPLFLEGEDLTLLSISVNGKELKEGPDYKLSKDGLTILASALPADGEFEVSTRVSIDPENNTQLSGLYVSGPMFCSQCEAEGFRRITYFQDRPDVMAKYRVRLEADQASFPILLSNGNKLEEGPSKTPGRHFALWEDPFPKPSYLFAVVAGDLGSISSSFKTKSGRHVTLNIYSEKDNTDKLDWAMESLKASMKWDEDKYNLEYDLDLFNVVAVALFNMGAMENKGLNIFNSAYVLARPDTATDLDYERIEGVIGHEYFHNWTGNRVTVADFFQLTLKEGLTVFRDQQFSADMGSYAVKRIEDVTSLRARQFAEDASMLSHPIRPESYIAMDNFYTATVYSKGAEVIRMYHTLLGAEGFRKGMDLYFKRHDGCAVTCDDFRFAMADANGVDLTQFELWYSTAGTPTVEATGTYDEAAKTFTLNLKQSVKNMKQPEGVKDPLHIPVAVGLMLRDGTEALPTKVLELKEKEQTFVFPDIPSSPIPSLLRDFSAPVKLRYEYTDEELAYLMVHDTDSFNRWEAGHKLAQRVIMQLVKEVQSGAELSPLPQLFVDSFRKTLAATEGDKSLQAYALSLPSMATLAEEMEVIDTDALGAVLKHCKTSLAKALLPELKAKYAALAPTGPYAKTSAEVSRRRLRNTVLGYISSLKDDAAAEMCYSQFTSANCMTDKIAALGSLSSIAGDKRETALEAFHETFKNDPDSGPLCKWFAVQATSDLPDLLDRVKVLTKHPDFTLKNPNIMRSLVSTFAGNMSKFHAKDGKGYEFICDMILEVDAINPQVASRLAGSFSQWRKYDKSRQEMMRAQLTRIKDAPTASKDVLEVATRCLG